MAVDAMSSSSVSPTNQGARCRTQKQAHQACRSSVISYTMVLLVTLLSLLSLASADDRLEGERASIAGGLLVDTNPAPKRRDGYAVGGVMRRQNDDATTTVTSSRVNPTVTATPTSNPSASSTDPSSTLTAVIATYTASTLPLPFDTNIGSNFTSTSCPNFFNAFIANTTFRQCAPVSLLLQNSYMWIQAIRDPSVLSLTLENSCGASLALCSPLMESIARDLILPSNCGDDFRRQNPLVTHAYAGLVAYEPLYKATCLKNNDTDNFCFAEALTNTGTNGTRSGAISGSNSYPYYAAIGLELPAGALPACSDCLRETMSIFAGYAKMRGQPLASTYLGAARQINGVCGSSFTDANVQVAVASPFTDAASNLQRSSTILAVLGTAMLWSIFIA